MFFTYHGRSVPHFSFSFLPIQQKNYLHKEIRELSKVITPVVIIFSILNFRGIACGRSTFIVFMDRLETFFPKKNQHTSFIILPILSL